MTHNRSKKFYTMIWLRILMEKLKKLNFYIFKYIKWEV